MRVGFLFIAVLVAGMVGCSSRPAPPDTTGYLIREGFDPERAGLGASDMFERYRVPDEGVPIDDVGWDDDHMVMVVERGGRARALSVEQMLYHHVAQGTLAGEPYVVTF